MKLFSSNISRHIETKFASDINKIIDLINDWWVENFNQNFGLIEVDSIRFGESIELNTRTTEEKWYNGCLINWGLKAILKLVFDLQPTKQIALYNADRILNTNLFNDTYNKIIDELKRLKENNYEI
ncbi:hypothetical protein [Mycoplasmopsis gallinacea]|uniref:Uncharacterized protein n=1 Tax=Mycoplasmopsis gallinacea TaxID=29556 RepID=A0A6H0V5W7_9BACT|nr:hypothetical protein [Mycoplasmopsis gallinacea]QIW62427.1 hypothetical protein GOQ20_03325 [Mycoplasmopsis gallinacea]